MKASFTQYNKNTILNSFLIYIMNKKSFSIADL